MARTYYTQQQDHTSDAGFRAWGLALSTALAAIGLVKTADTGQVDWATVTKPAVSTDVYEIWRFSDALQATAPVYLKIFYGTGGISTTCRLRCQVATGTNGAGTLTGIIGTASQNNTSTGSAAQAWPTYACFKDGTFTLAWQVGYTINCLWVIDRTRDNNGAATGRGIFTMLCSNAGYQYNHIEFLTAVAIGTASSSPATVMPFIGCIAPPQNNSATGALVNLYNWFYFGPDLVPLVGLLTYKAGEIAAAAEFDVAIVGGTARHYLAMPAPIALGSATGVATDKIAILWEV